MDVINRIVALLLITTLVASNKERFGDGLKKESRCGGPIEADSGKLTFPSSFEEEGEGTLLQEGEAYLCIWTIHLQTTSLFRLNVTNLDIPSEDVRCAEGALRIYPLTNMLSEEEARLESYTFCNQALPPQGYFYHAENLITVVYFFDGNSSGNYGFTLNFEGVSTQPVPKIHESSFTSFTSGIIRYPVSGEYLANRVSTWAVKTGDLYPDLQFDLNIGYVRVESCRQEDPCLCDALLVCEVTNKGVVREVGRYCENLTGADISGMGANFIAAFFTDNHETAGVGEGFQLLYRPLLEESTSAVPTIPDRRI